MVGYAALEAGLHEEHGELVAGVFAGLGVAAADDEVDPAGVAGVPAASEAAAHGMECGGVYFDVLEKLQSLFVGEDAGFLVLLVEGVEELVGAAAAHGV